MRLVMVWTNRREENDGRPQSPDSEPRGALSATHCCAIQVFFFLHFHFLFSNNFFDLSIMFHVMSQESVIMLSKWFKTLERKLSESRSSVLNLLIFTVSEGHMRSSDKAPLPLSAKVVLTEVERGSWTPTLGQVMLPTSASCVRRSCSNIRFN